MWEGPNFLRNLRVQTAFTGPVVILSGSTRPDAAQKALGLGAAAYFEKPHKTDDLLPIVRRIHDRWLATAN
jgi:AmiR/NasT family two-component response regulator